MSVAAGPPPPPPTSGEGRGGGDGGRRDPPAGARAGLACVSCHVSALVRSEGVNADPSAPLEFRVEVLGFRV